MEDGLKRRFEFAAGDPGPRLDLFLAASLGLPRKRAGRLVASGKVTVNGAKIKKGAALNPGDRVAIDLTHAERAAEAPPAVRVVHEDAEIVVVDKPAGLHSAALPEGGGASVAAFLLAMYPEMARVGFSLADAGLVHRLDRDTSGLLLAARTARAFERLRRQFEARTIRKTYLALVHGTPPARGVIDRPIRRKGRRGHRVHVLAAGESAGDAPGGEVLPAVTRYRLKETAGDFALLEVDLETGVMHQIRAHLAAIGHPVVGDPIYGDGTDGDGAADAPRHLLHAWKLSFVHPGTDRSTHLVSPLPDDFHAVLDALRDAEVPRRP
jgi:23S rRNA pseudouridine1911/1915/1917 synthase